MDDTRKAGLGRGNEAVRAVNSASPANGRLGILDAESASNLIAAAADVALVLDGNGVIRDVALGSDDVTLLRHRLELAALEVEHGGGR